IVKYKASIHTNNTTLNKDNNPTPTLYFFRLSNTFSCSSELILPFDSLPCMSLAYSPCCTSFPCGALVSPSSSKNSTPSSLVDSASSSKVSLLSNPSSTSSSDL